MSDKTEIERTKEEIKWLRTQRNIAIIASIVSIFFNFAPYLVKFYKSTTKATIKIVLEDEYLRKTSEIRILSNNDKSDKMIICGHPNEIPEIIHIDSGSYKIELKHKGHILDEKIVYLNKKEKREIKFEKYFEGLFCVYPTLRARTVNPEMPLPITVESSKTGFLWIYEIEGPKVGAKLLFPRNSTSNKIYSGKEFILSSPRRGELFLKAGNDKCDETLLFIVTEKNDVNFSNFIANRYSKSPSIEKAVLCSTNNMRYGLGVIHYKIEK